MNDIYVYFMDMNILQFASFSYDTTVHVMDRVQVLIAKAVAYRQTENKTKHTGLPFFRAFCKIPRFTGLQTKRGNHGAWFVNSVFLFKIFYKRWLALC